MEARHAVQSALRTASSSTRVTAVLLALRRTTPAASSIVRQQSSTAAAAGSAPASTSATQTTTPPPSRTWPVPSSHKSSERLDASSPINWIKPRSTIGGRGGGRSGNGTGAINRLLDLQNLKLPTSSSRSFPIGDAFVNEANSAMSNLPSPQMFSLQSFLDVHRMRAASKEWNKRLRPVLGRTVPCTANVDAARAFQLLQLMVKRNRVAADFNRQRFHERGGLKRKRLKSERWRYRFKVSFRATVKRVQQLVKQGW